MALYLREAGPADAPCLVFLHGLWLSSAMAPGGGHVWNLQAPDLFNETVCTWITDQLLPRELVVFG
jgi:hypothetical protein